jgi:hypothetical protein
MRRFAAALVVLCWFLPLFASGSADDVVTIEWNGFVVNLRGIRGACQEGWLRGARYPRGEKQNYVMGCWYIDSKALNIKFDDGVEATIDRATLDRSKAGKIWL